MKWMVNEGIESKAVFSQKFEREIFSPERKRLKIVGEMILDNF